MTDRTEPSNPYAPPEAAIGPPPDAGPRNPRRSAEALRLRHLDDEAMVRSVALLFRIVTVALPLVAFGVGIALGRVSPWGPAQFALIAAAIAAPVLTGLIASGLTSLRPWSRGAALIVAGAGLAIAATGAWTAFRTARPLSAFPLFLATVPLGLVVFLLASRDGRVVFSGRYRDAIGATPHLTPKTSILVPLAFALAAGWAGLAWLWQLG